MKEVKNEPNPQIIKRLQMSLNHSFGHFPRTGLRYFITIDLKNAYNKSKYLSRTIFKNNKKPISFLKEQVLLKMNLHVWKQVLCWHSHFSSVKRM